MKTHVAICLGVVLMALAFTAASRAAERYPCRWVYVSRGLHRDQDVEDIRGIVASAAGHKLNGMVLAAGLDRLDLQPEHYFKRLAAVKRICDEAGVEIIPIIFSAGYGGSVLAHFSGLGLKTLSGAYYDGDTLENPAGWLETLDRTPGAVGIMYTTWQNKYALLGQFGDLVSKR